MYIRQHWRDRGRRFESCPLSDEVPACLQHISRTEVSQASTMSIRHFWMHCYMFATASFARLMPFKHSISLAVSRTNSFVTLRNKLKFFETKADIISSTGVFDRCDAGAVFAGRRCHM